MRRLLQRRPKAPASDGDSSSASASTTASSRKIFPSGIKLLYKAENSVVDIIFVHGLTGDREKTWTAKNNAAPWPQSLLPFKVPNARVLTFGYDAYVTDLLGLVSTNRIGNHSMNLLTTIATFREDDDTNNRPIIFVCHSLGGLVCEDALVAARQRPERHLQSILNSTRGIIFLGTPHHGAGLARWAETLARSIGVLKQTNSRILAVLESDSEVLARIQDSFHTMIRSRSNDGLQQIEITCFYEELPLLGVGIVVPSQSAILPGYIPIGIRSNHMDMTKFENGDDPGFTAVAGELRRWVKESIAPSNAEVTTSDALKRKQADQQPDEQQSGMFLVPYISNPGFVSRSDILEALKKRLAPCLQPNRSATQARAALFGLGGIGKTQIALAYAYWIQVEFPAVSVFWVHASNAERFHQAFSQIAKSCQVPGYSDPKVNILELVKASLERKDQRPWLMIIDNADDTDMFFSSVETAPQELGNPSRLPLEGTLGRYIPECSHGAILVTTRNKQTGSKLTKGRGIIEVGQMDQADSNQLVHKKLENDDLDQNDISTLTARLGNIPLAVVQATAFIQMNSMTVARYLQLLDQSDNALVELLSQPFETEGRDDSIPNAVTATWIVSFEKIKKQHPHAADFLSLLSFFDRQEIPKMFLLHYVKKSFSQEEHQQKQEDQAKIELEKTLGILKAFSFILEGKDNGNLNMHHMIPLVMRNWLQKESKLGEWACKALLIVSELYPYGNYEDWKICEDYFPHASAVLSYGGSSFIPTAVSRATLLYNTASFMHQRGQWNKAEKFLLEVVETRMRVFGSEDAETLNGMSDLALVYFDQGRLKEAEELWTQVMETQKRVLGDEDQATLGSIINLTMVYLDQGRFKEAEELGVRAVEMNERILGDEHPQTLDSMHSLAVIYEKQGRWGKAEALEVEVLKMRKRVLGDEHPNTLLSMHFLAATYKEQGRWGKAEALGVEVLKTYKRVLGDEHRHTLTIMQNLAATYKEQGRWGEAETLERKALEMRKRVLGDEHPDTLNSMDFLASTYQKQGRWGEAETLGIKILEMRKRVSGDEHPDTLTIMNNLALTYQEQGRSGEAEALGVKVLEMRKRVLGDDHPFTLISMGNLASIYCEQKRLQEAEELHIQVLTKSQKILRKEHPDTLTSMNNLAVLWKDQNRNDEAINLMVECVQLGNKVGEEIIRTRKCQLNY